VNHPEPSSMVSTVAERVASVQTQIAAACARVHRPVDSVTLIAVSKTHPASLILEAVAAGLRDFGENRVEESGKIKPVNERAGVPLTWHMIGHVQSRKAREVTRHFRWIHSLDSVKLAERYARFAQADNVMLNVLLEVNVSGEATKEGLEANRWQSDPAQRADLWAAVRQIVALPGLRVRGLMTIAPIVPEPEQARPYFVALRKLRDGVANDFPVTDWQTLSMGMTDDYSIAIEEGATFVRIGRAIFGAREQVQDKAER